MSAAVTPRHARHTDGLMRSIYLPRTADALAFAMSTYGIPLLVLATTRSAALTGAALALEYTVTGRTTAEVTECLDTAADEITVATRADR